MEVSSSSSSSPLSAVYSVDFSPVLNHHHRFKSSISLQNHLYSSKFKISSLVDCHKFLNPIRSSPFSCSTTFGVSISQTNPSLFNSPYLPTTRINKGRSRRRSPPISAVFERFTERAIKAVVFSQREAKALGKDMVFTQHLLLGLIAEDRASSGFLGSGITIEQAREAVRTIWNDEDDKPSSKPANDDSVPQPSSSTDIPFSISTKRVFEAAVEYSRNMGYNFIAPEHISIGLFTVDDGSAGRVLKRF